MTNLTTSPNLTTLTNEEVMCLVGLLNEELDEGRRFMEHTSAVAGKVVKTYQADAMVLVAKLLEEARRRGLVKPPSCFALREDAKS